MTPGFRVYWFSPVVDEFDRAARQPKERAKIDRLIGGLESFGFSTPGVRFEKIRGGAQPIYELKITAYGSEHRFLAGFSARHEPDGRRVLVLLRYVKKKKWKLSRTDIETAASRFRAAEARSGHGA